MVWNGYRELAPFRSRGDRAWRSRVAVAFGTVSSACGDVGAASSEGGQMTIPGHVCQHQVKTHYPSNGALDLHVEAGQDLNAMAIFAVLVWIPQVPAALQELSLGPGCVFIQLHRGGRRPGGGAAATTPACQARTTNARAQKESGECLRDRCQSSPRRCGQPLDIIIWKRRGASNRLKSRTHPDEKSEFSNVVMLEMRQADKEKESR